MKRTFRDTGHLNKIIGLLYLLAALFYLLDWMVPFCVAILLAIIFLLLSIQNKDPSRTQAASYRFRELGILIFAAAILIRTFLL